MIGQLHDYILLRFIYKSAPDFPDNKKKREQLLEEIKQAINDKYNINVDLERLEFFLNNLEGIMHIEVGKENSKVVIDYNIEILTKLLAEKQTLDFLTGKTNVIRKGGGIINYWRL